MLTKYVSWYPKHVGVELLVEGCGQIAGELYMLSLIFTDGNLGRLVEEYVCCL